MNTILTIFGTVIITWLIVRELFYSPRARVKKLWKGISRLSREVGEQNKRFPDVPNPMVDVYEKIIYKKKRMINALLDYHFDPEEDQEYIEENRP
jgi:hypothetical protein